MRRFSAYAWIFLALFLVCKGNVFAQDSSDDFGKALESLKIYVPEDEKARLYLGIDQSDGQIAVNQINAEVLIIEIFSMYCPHCQRHAPISNNLFNTISGNDDIKDKVKIIGIGIGNSAYEVDLFREKYNILFPLFDDRGSAVINVLKGVATPHYFGVRLKVGGPLDVFYSKSAGYSDADEFLKLMLDLSGFKSGGD